LLLPDATPLGIAGRAWLKAAIPSGTAVAEVVATPSTVPAAGEGAGDNLEFGTWDLSPLGGRRRAATALLPRHLPVERERRYAFPSRWMMSSPIHANAHYHHLFDGKDKLFCPLAIGDVESRLDKSRFVRVHRSHIVNIDRVVGYRRSG